MLNLRANVEGLPKCHDLFPCAKAGMAREMNRARTSSCRIPRRAFSKEVHLDCIDQPF
jgi:hypothetical protein